MLHSSIRRHVLPPLVASASMARIENHLLPPEIKASLVPSQLSLLAEKPILVPSLAVARPETHRLVHVIRSNSRVETHALTRISQFTLSNGFSRDEELGEDCVEIPLERLALQIFPKLLPRFNISILSDVF